MPHKINPLTTIALGSRAFTFLKSRPKRPAGSYVKHKGLFYSTKGRDYPMNVLVDSATKNKHQIVIVSGGLATFAFLSSTDRRVDFPAHELSDEDQRNNYFVKRIARLALLSDHEEIIVIGEHEKFTNNSELSKFKFNAVDLKDLHLPPIMNWGRIIGMIIMPMLIIGLSISITKSIQSSKKQEDTAVTERVSLIETELSTLMDTVSDGRKKIAEASPQIAEKAKVLLPLPVSKGSFLEYLDLKKTDSSKNIKVENGDIKS
jgi:hypothetical protein